MSIVHSAHLVVVPPSSDAFVAALDRSVTTIGSGRDAIVRITDPEIASLHATVHKTDSGFLIERHAQPFQVAGRKVRQHQLAPFDLVTLGRTAISFRFGPAPPRVGAAGPGPSALEVCRRLNDFTASLRENAPVEQLAAALLSDVLTLTGGTRGALVRLSGGEPLALGLHTTSHGDFSRAESDFSRTAIARMQEEGKPLLFTDTSVDRDLSHAPSIVREDARSVICAPIRQHDGQLIGALYASSSRSKPFTPQSLELLTLYAHHAVFLVTLAEQRRALTARLEEAGQEAAPTTHLVGSCTAMRKVIQEIRKIASHDVSVLLSGETGTGKELVAREIHRFSARSRGPFVAVDCASIPESLFQSEMFGHVKGAFTHAYQDRSGWIRSAHRGTLFLDEIAELPLTRQVMLLRVLQEQQVCPVGGDRALPVDFRLICATNRDLQQAIAEHRFRQDLYYRIADMVIALPPLRDREDDALELAHYFLHRQRSSAGRPELRLGASAITAIRKARWEGNVRELEAAVRKAVAMAETDTISAEDLRLTGSGPPEDAVRPLGLARDEFLKDYVRAVVARFGGNRSAAAKALMVSDRTVFKYLEEV